MLIQVNSHLSMAEINYLAIYLSASELDGQIPLQCFLLTVSLFSILIAGRQVIGIVKKIGIRAPKK